MISWMKNAISNLYNTVTTPVAATRDALSTQFEHVRKKVASLFNRVKESEEMDKRH